MLSVASWWLAFEALGLGALPITLRLFRPLPERGYGLSKLLGLLLTGYIIWIGGSFGFLRLTRATILTVIILAALYCLRHTAEVVAFLRQNVRLVIVTELVFTVSFLAWVLYRAYNPDIAATEKPMEFAFLNAIVRAGTVPPPDPWLSGFAISYYYFGYFLMALLTVLAGVRTAVAFNLIVATLFAATMSGAFSLVTNLVASYHGGMKRALAWGLVGALLVTEIGNVEGLLEVLHARGLGSLSFWQWVDVKGLADAPVTGAWFPSDGWWWWRASRVIHDRDLLGRSMEVIDEFPLFSFVLGDVHPHVLALPFVLLALALGFSTLLNAMQEAPADATGVRAHMESLVRRQLGDLLLACLILGGLGFLNTWDFPVYLLIVVACHTLGRFWREGRWPWDEALGFALLLGVGGVLLYLPFYIGFRSQAGGLLPNLINGTRLHQYLIMFGLLIFTAAGFLLVQLAHLGVRVGVRKVLQQVLWYLVICIGGPGMLLGGLAAGLVFTPLGRSLLQEEVVREQLAGRGLGEVARQVLAMRLGDPWLALFLALGIAVGITLLARSRETGETGTPHAAVLFCVLLVVVALLLSLGVEFVYLRDAFGTRMNTVFKFYYQAWVLLAVAAPVTLGYTLEHLRTGARLAWGLCWGVLLVAQLVYPLGAIWAKAGGFAGKPTLDGTAFYQQLRPDDYAAVEWLNRNVRGTVYIVEANGPSYSPELHNMVSAFTGLPTVLGWGFHELQWRGNYAEPGRREPDIVRIYQSGDPNEVLTLLDKYAIMYVYVGDLERSKFGLSPEMAARFGLFMDRVYSGGGVAIYRVR
ncbi:MAG: hypothetical protein H5T64_05070 [Chloroflexi bacterium]|nr:hypothetical protein [Chloroflexota bacterium]